MPHATARTAGVLVTLAAVLTAGAPGVVRIRPGDTLWGLARQHHTSVRALLDLNHLSGNAVIYAGATLLVPAAPQPGRPASRGTAGYVVRPGDNLTWVARRLHTSITDLRARNHLRSDLLLVGQRLGYAGAPAARPPERTGAREVAGLSRSAAADRAVLAGQPVPGRAAVRAMIVSSARRHGLDPALALAVSWQESGFQQRVVSPVDAVGVMQVLPSTARSLGRAHGRTFHVLQAGDNIEAGVLLLRDLVQATGSWQRALAGYYQGLGSVHRVGLLPQTRSYIRNVGFLRARFS